MRLRLAAMGAFALLHASGAVAATVTESDLNRIFDEGFNHSQAAATTLHLTDRIGGRLTNSPQMRQAEAWTAAKLQAWGLTNVRKEGFTFGRGWSPQAWYVTMTEPRLLQLTTVPVAWTPGIDDQVTAPVAFAPMASPRDFEAWRGKLKGRIVLIDPPGEVVALKADPAGRWTDAELAERGVVRPPAPGGAAALVERATFAPKLDAFLKAEGAVAWISKSYRDRKILHGVGAGFRLGETPALPGFEMAAEDYRRLARVAQAGDTPVLRVRDIVHFHDEDPKAYNILADIPGTDPKAGYVMAGAHLDSWQAGDGAMDNAAGSAIVMEAARILSTLKVKPRRTIRVALFSGEEQGMFGSRAYVDRHIGSRPGFLVDNATLAQSTSAGLSDNWPLTPRATHDDLKIYFNLDSGGGRIRGLSTQGNLAALPLLEKWMRPLKGLGATVVSPGIAGGTDSTSFMLAGAPATTFTSDMHDALTTHHTNVDTYDHLTEDDLRQASVVVAALLLQAANDPDSVPRMPLPTPPRAPAN